jgi:alpha-amylase/alpha-mannosidase (GH57 family)
MALAYALERLAHDERIRLTNYGELLERHPPRHAVRIRDRTSWSCEHGVARWTENCGCASGELAGGHQSWRAPLREALDWLRDTVAPLFEQRALRLLRRPWAARDDYVELLLDRSREAGDRFLSRHVRRPVSNAERDEILDLLEMQRHALLMYASCGWFFDDPSRIETVQLLCHAGRVVDLAERRFGEPVEAALLERLARVESSHAGRGDARGLYERLVVPLRGPVGDRRKR